MKNKIKLSICIPTRNRADFIGTALDSVISQADDRVEIVIVDGASTDNTEEVVNRYQTQFKNFVYYRAKVNGGVNRDMAKTIELANGEYCWMLSDDDALTPGAINRMLKEIESGYEIYLSNVTACDLQMRRIRDRFWLSIFTKDRVFNLHECKDLIAYCDKANSIGALFSYMSSIVLNRNEWLKIGYDYDFDKTAYALAATLFSFIKHRCRLKYIRDQLVYWRNDNVSFQDAWGMEARYLLDLDGYFMLAGKFLPNDRQLRSSFYRVMRREHPWYTIVHVLSTIEDPKAWDSFKEKLVKFGYSPKMAELYYYLSRHKNILNLAVAIKRKIVKSRAIHKILYLPRRIFIPTIK
ncbi:MAG: glycosyltransferase family 2 protein [Candidatus Omnitrophica bacterium]|nr:glycosyltransferase family 2 protein [Candidatus Omnitrophota bacterium]